MKYCPHCGAAIAVSAACFCPACGRLRRGSSPSAQFPQGSAKQTRSACRPQGRPVDDGYDGYYRDTPVADGGQVRTGLDPALAKKIVLLALGVVLVIALAMLAMYFL